MENTRVVVVRQTIHGVGVLVYVTVVSNTHVEEPMKLEVVEHPVVVNMKVVVVQMDICGVDGVVYVTVV